MNPHFLAAQTWQSCVLCLCLPIRSAYLGFLLLRTVKLTTQQSRPPPRRCVSRRFLGIQRVRNVESKSRGRVFFKDQLKIEQFFSVRINATLIFCVELNFYFYSLPFLAFDQFLFDEWSAYKLAYFCITHFFPILSLARSQEREGSSRNCLLNLHPSYILCTYLLVLCYHAIQL